MIRKAASEKIINLNIEEVVSAIKIIYLDAEMFVEKTIVAFIFEMNGSGIHTAIILMSQDITVLLQIIALGSEIRYLRTVVFLLVPCLVNVVTKEQQTWILHHKFGQLC